MIAMTLSLEWLMMHDKKTHWEDSFIICYLILFRLLLIFINMLNSKKNYLENTTYAFRRAFYIRQNVHFNNCAI